MLHISCELWKCSIFALSPNVRIPPTGDEILCVEQIKRVHTVLAWSRNTRNTYLRSLSLNTKLKLMYDIYCTSAYLQWNKHLISFVYSNETGWKSTPPTNSRLAFWINITLTFSVENLCYFCPFEHSHSIAEKKYIGQMDTVFNFVWK